MQQTSFERDVVDRYVAGESCPEIAAAIGRSTSFVWMIVKRAGVGRSHSESMALRMAKLPNLSEHRGFQCAFHSKKNDTWIPAGSRYEYLRMEQLEADPCVVAFNRCTDRIRYSFSGVSRYYIPDFQVALNDGSVRVEEVKPSTMVDKPQVVAKVAAARAHYRPSGIDFSIVTEHEIGTEKIRCCRLSGLAAIMDDAFQAARRDRERVRQRQSARRKLAAMTQHERDLRNEQQRAHHRLRAETMSPEEIADRRAKNAAAQRRCRANKVA